MPIPPEDLPVKIHHDIYPGIDPTPHFEQKTYTGKTVLIAGASRGIGACIAKFYARAGANLALVGRSKEGLLGVREEIKDLAPEARVGVFEGDVCDVGDVERVVREVVEDGTDAGLGRRLDIVVACAGKVDLYDRPFTEDDPEKWWKTVEANLRGVYNIAHFTLPHLDKTSGYFIITSSTAAQCRIPLISPYAISKHAVGRLNEYIPIEHPKVKSIAFHPGTIKTAMTDMNPSIAEWCVDSVELAAGCCLKLTGGGGDWLSGRFYDATWDFDEVEEKWKERIVEDGGLVSRLSIPL